MESSALNEEKLLSGELKNVVEEYHQGYGSEEKRQNLLQVLQNNDCREVIAKCIDGDGISNAFVWAGYRNHFDILQAFLDQGMNVGIKNRNGDNTLIYAAINGHEESVQLLCNQTSDVSVQNNDGWTALMIASANGRKDIVQLLLNRNADIDLKNSKDKTALDLASTNEIKEMICNHVNTSYVLK